MISPAWISSRFPRCRLPMEPHPITKTRSSCSCSLLGIIREDLAHGLDYVACVLIGHAMKQRQTDQLLVRGFGHGIVPGFMPEAFLVIRMEMNWNIMNADPKVFST